ncbi:hypothetical protein FH608_027620 [Nonomuraea phyllanthi]|uniref:LamG-like jellyroll fold domain-containing protein n=2 Tax=Nonomuraea phyllanthi TaxID=2219224 RepID=A0A5C4W438_9ACTN|nr:hypothetical protein FH608_027620 [Nonomuraea phyllanthi]
MGRRSRPPPSAAGAAPPLTTPDGARLMVFDSATQQRLDAAQGLILDHYGDDPNVNGAGVGFRIRGGQSTGEPAVIVFVTKKRPASHLSRSRLLPRKVDVGGLPVEVDVYQAGPFSTGDAGAASLERSSLLGLGEVINERIRPLRTGSSVSGTDSPPSAGTLGLFVRDNSDGTVCMLSNNHVIGRFGQSNPPPGHAILQPGRYDDGESPDDEVATLKRIVPTPYLGTNVDAAIAELRDQTEGSGWSRSVARDRMAPVSGAHPVVGMVTAGDSFGGTLLTRMDAAVEALDVTPILGGRSLATTLGSIFGGRSSATASGPIAGVLAPVPGMLVEKVGRTTGYTSSVIIATGVRAPVSTPRGPVLYTDLVFVPYLSMAGDSGSAVLLGGTGKDIVPPWVFLLFLCPLLLTVGTYYELPLVDDHDVGDRFRDEFLTQSRVGRLLLRLPYINELAVTERLANVTASPDEIAYADQYYSTYRDFMVEVLNDPDSPEVVTEEHLEDAGFVINGLAQTVLTSMEANLAFSLYEKALKPTLGMNRRQVLAYMDEQSLYDLVLAELESVPSIELYGAAALPRLPVPVAWWKFDGNASDSSGSGHALTLLGSRSWIADGQVGGALRLGADGRAVTSGPVADTSGGFTVAGWFRASSTLPEDFYPGISQGDGGAGFDLSAYAGRWWLSAWSGDIWTETESVVAVTAGAWMHLAAVYDPDGEFIRIYVNGRWTGPAARMTFDQPAPGEMSIGGYSSGPYFNGDIDDLRVYDQAMTPALVYDLVHPTSADPATARRLTAKPRLAPPAKAEDRRRVKEFVKARRRPR